MSSAYAALAVTAVVVCGLFLLLSVQDPGLSMRSSQAGHDACMTAMAPAGDDVSAANCDHEKEPG